MKLRNRKTGEIATLTLSSNGEELLLMKNNEMVTRNVKLSDLEEWEDYEEPKGIQGVDVLGANDGRVVIQYSNEEEAEKAVEKLKAWKRLRDNGFNFDDWERDKEFSGDYIIKASDYHTCDDKDLDLLFCTEVKNEI